MCTCPSREICALERFDRLMLLFTGRGVILHDLRVTFFWGREASLGAGRAGNVRCPAVIVRGHAVVGRVCSNIEGVMTILRKKEKRIEMRKKEILFIFGH